MRAIIICRNNTKKQIINKYPTKYLKVKNFELDENRENETILFVKTNSVKWNITSTLM